MAQNVAYTEFHAFAFQPFYIFSSRDRLIQMNTILAHPHTCIYYSCQQSGALIKGLLCQRMGVIMLGKALPHDFCTLSLSNV